MERADNRDTYAYSLHFARIQTDYHIRLPKFFNAASRAIQRMYVKSNQCISLSFSTISFENIDGKIVVSHVI